MVFSCWSGLGCNAGLPAGGAQGFSPPGITHWSSAGGLVRALGMDNSSLGPALELTVLQHGLCVRSHADAGPRPLLSDSWLEDRAPAPCVSGGAPLRSWLVPILSQCPALPGFGSLAGISLSSPGRSPVALLPRVACW